MLGLADLLLAAAVLKLPNKVYLRGGRTKVGLLT